MNTEVFGQLDGRVISDSLQNSDQDREEQDRRRVREQQGTEVMTE
jgi:hypothetical protein